MTTPSKSDGKLIADALRKAKKYLAYSNNNNSDTLGQKFICLAMCQAYENGEMTVFTFNKSAEYISGLLGCCSLEAWLRKNHPELTSEILKDYQGVKIQATRHAWLDNMIKELESSVLN